VRLLLSGEDAAPTQVRGVATRVCARRSVFLGHKPLLLGGPGEANAWLLALGAHIFPRAGLRFPYPSSAEQGHAAPRLLLWDAGRLANAPELLALAARYTLPPGARDTRARGGLAQALSLSAAQAARLSPPALAALFAGVQVLLTPAGEGSAHALLLPPRSAVILVHGFQAWHPRHARIATLAGHNVLPLFSRIKGPGVRYAAAGAFSRRECDSMGLTALASSPCADAFAQQRVVVPLASFESALIDAIALVSRRRVQHDGASGLDALEGAPPASMPIPVYYDARYTRAIAQAFCTGRCARMDATMPGARLPIPGNASGTRDVLEEEDAEGAVL